MAPNNPLFQSAAGDFPVQVHEHVRWGDMDAFGHMNNAVYFRMFESARMVFLQRTGFMDQLDRHGIGPILAHTECHFRRPLSYPSELLVGTRTRSVDEYSVAMDYGMFICTDDMPLAACGTGRVVCYDYTAKCKAPIPGPLRKQLEGLRRSEGKDLSA